MWSNHCLTSGGSFFFATCSGPGAAGAAARRKLVKVLFLGVAIVFVCLVSPPLFQSATVVQKPLQSGSSIASDSHRNLMRWLARTRRVRRTQAFRCSLSELVPLGVLDRGALEELFLFCRRERRKVFAQHLHLDSAGDLDLAQVLSDALDVEQPLRHGASAH